MKLPNSRDELREQIAEMATIDLQIEELLRQRSSLETTITIGVKTLMPNLGEVGGEKRFRSGPHVVSIRASHGLTRVHIYKLGTEEEL